MVTVGAILSILGTLIGVLGPVLGKYLLQRFLDNQKPEVKYDKQLQENNKAIAAGDVNAILDERLRMAKSVDLGRGKGRE